MISKKLAVSAAAIAAAAIGGQVAAVAASAATTPAAQVSAYPAAYRSARHDAVRAVLTDSQTYTVQSGDTLSGIGARFGISWQALYAANESVVGPNPNLIFAGEVLSLTGATSAQSQASAPEQAQPEQTQQSGQPQQPQQPQQSDEQVQSSAQQSDTAQSSAAGNASGGAAPGSFQQCVIQAESGGNAQVMNSSGHYGLYQFSQSTWDAAGGNPADFGNASAAEQNQVFQNAYSMWGTSPWAPYDGC
jgi:LysM repeat protein